MTDYAQIVKASKVVGSLLPDKKNKQQNYEYISADKILERAGRALADAGLALVPEIVSADVDTVEYTDGYGKTKTRYDARLGMTMHICGNGDPLTIGWFGYGVDYASPDKAVAKAITTAHKYFLMKLLNIGIGNEDGEHEPPAGGSNGNGHEDDAGNGSNGKGPQEPADPVEAARGRARSSGREFVPALADVTGWSKDDIKAAAKALGFKGTGATGDERVTKFNTILEYVDLVDSGIKGGLAIAVVNEVISREEAEAQMAAVDDAGEEE